MCCSATVHSPMDQWREHKTRSVSLRSENSSGQHQYKEGALLEHC